MSTTPFKIGDYVTSQYHNREIDLVRLVTDILKSASDQWLVSASDGGRCPHCHRPYGHRIQFGPAKEFTLSNGNPDNTDLIRADADDRYAKGIPFDILGIPPSLSGGH